MTNFTNSNFNNNFPQLIPINKGGDYMFYEDNRGNILTEEEVLKLNTWEMEELGIHVADIRFQGM
jgi:hypothetical protein